MNFPPRKKKVPPPGVEGGKNSPRASSHFLFSASSLSPVLRQLLPGVSMAAVVLPARS